MRFEVGCSGKIVKTFTKEEVKDFARICGDDNPIHFDDEAAKESPFGRPIIHGILSASLISAVLGTKMPGPGTIYLGQTIQFLKPVFVGDTVTAVATIEELSDKGKAKISTIITNQKSEIVVSGNALVKLPN